ncbi:hypothetical protein [Rheinheimera sp.]|uniref:hypothetical protein n=1 Tax=Rheinheimera sp. TaxID=1869214 RepID=UPI0040480DDF
MSDLAIAITVFIAILAAGALRAYVDKNIAIFCVSAFFVAVMSAAIALYEAGLFYPWVEFLFVALALLAGVAIEAFNQASSKDAYTM